MTIAAAIDWAERELVKAEGLREAVAVLQTLRSAEGLAQSLETRAHDAKTDLAKAEASLITVRAQIEQNKSEAEAWAESHMDSAKAKAAEIEAKAGETAKKMLATADKRREELEAKAAAAESRAAEAEAACRATKQEHDDLTAKLEAARAKAREMLG